jgi:hypothetical protein
MKATDTNQNSQRYPRLGLLLVLGFVFSGAMAIGWSDRGSSAKNRKEQGSTKSPRETNPGFFRSPALFSPAGIINVNSTAQSPGASGDCTLGEAIQAANTNLTVDGCGAGSSVGADTIVLPAGTYTLSTVAFTDNGFFGDAGLPGIMADVVIQGAGAATTIIERSPNATAQFRLLVVANQNGGSIVLNDLTMRGGRSSSYGGALYTGGRPVTLNRVVFDDNRAVTYAGAVATSSQGGLLVANDCTFTNNQTNGQGGAIVASPATISNSTFTGNSAVYGGALYYHQGSGANFNITDSTFTGNHAAASAGIGGAIYYSGTANIHRSRFEGNSAGSTNSSGGAIAGLGTLNLFDSLLNDNEANEGGGLHLSNCNVTITRSTISNNQALTHFGGGIYFNTGSGTVSASTINGNTAGIDGGGLWTSNINLTLANVTVDSNTSGQYGGGIYYQSFSPKTLTVNNVTVTGNVAASQGGGIFRYDFDGTISAKNSIIALNTSNINNAPNIYAPTAGTFTSLGYNLIGVKDGANFTNAAGDQTGTSANPLNPLLGPLQNNGGTTFTRALLAGSPALDAASPSLPGSGGDACETTDQRGISRPQDANNDGVAICDVGAFEQLRVPVCVPPPAGLVGWWPFDDNSDDIQAHNNASLFGNQNFAPGKVDQALAFDGIEDHAVAPGDAVLDVGLSDGMTFDLWFNPTEIQTARPLIEWESGAGPHLWMSADFGEGGRGVGSLFVNLPDAAGNYHIFSSAPGLLDANTWQHVAVTYDKTSGVAKIYLNGAPVAEQNFGSFRAQTTGDVFFGYRPFGVLAGRRFLGAIDEVEIFNRALSAEEIQSIYYADYAGKCKPNPSPTPTPTPTPATIEISEQIIVSDAVTLLPSAMIGVNENISVQDTPALLPSAMIGVSENISVQDTPTLLPSAMIGVSENIVVHDSVEPRPAALLRIDEQISVSDTPTLDICRVSLSASTQAFIADGGTGVVTVTAPCAWTASSDASFLTLTSSNTGTGNGSVSFRVAANTGPARDGTLRIGSEVFTVYQTGTCGDVGIVPPNPQFTVFGPTGGLVTYRVSNASPTCRWTAVSNDPFITVLEIFAFDSTKGGGVGVGSVTFVVAPNSGPPRTGSVTIDGKIFTLSQGNCSYATDPEVNALATQPTVFFPLLNELLVGPHFFKVNAPVGCFWQATSNDNFIVIDPEHFASDRSDLAGIFLRRNFGLERRGTVYIAGQTVTVKQAAWPTNNLPTGSGTNVGVSAFPVSATFTNVSTAGVTMVTPIDPNSAGQVPGGYQISGVSFAFDVTTTAQYSGSINICFTVQSVTDPVAFANLRILHNENGILVDRTSSRYFPNKTICATVNSLSPFVLAQVVSGPQQFMQSVLVDLKRLRETATDKRDQQRLDEVIRHLESALHPSNWLDQTHLASSRGASVFGKIESAIAQLSALKKDKKTDVQIAALQIAIEQLLQTARLIAQTEVNDAETANGNPSEIASALAALFEGDANVAAGNYNLAVSNYREAWRYAAIASASERGFSDKR